MGTTSSNHRLGRRSKRPEILAPAGNRASFFAAVSAGADAVYCGLKSFSARMEAKNFSVSELGKAVRLAREKNVRVYVPFNTMLGTGDLRSSASLLGQLAAHVRPDALIVQDLGAVHLARQAGFAGEIHLSTLAHVSFPKALGMIRKKFGVDRVVLPRELNIDEVKSMAAACPPGLGLEIFVHGALCYAVSGRCYWSSYLGGKSGLRGQCVQPCRRLYHQAGRREKFFSCQDLSLDVLVKVLRDISQIGAWKIEGRKKGPNYVYYTTTAYRMLRDEGDDAQARKAAVGLLERALGRPGTHFFFLPQRQFNPVDSKGQTASGLRVGKVGGSRKNPFLIPQEPLYSGDVLRVGYEDETWHKIVRVGKYVPKRGRFYIKTGDQNGPDRGTPVFLTDRQEKELQRQISRMKDELDTIPDVPLAEYAAKVKLPAKNAAGMPAIQMTVQRAFSSVKTGKGMGIWLSNKNVEDSTWKKRGSAWWWLPPVIWPSDEGKIADLIGSLAKRGQRHFVLNAPWQRALFTDPEKCRLWAGPFCNIANPFSVQQLKDCGFSGAFVSPELSAGDVLSLPKNSPLPMGIVTYGNWPLCISRVLPTGLEMTRAFTSPKKEDAWAVSHDECVWVYPNWELDIRMFTKKLEKAGYRLFASLVEPVPSSIKMKRRPGNWNWDLPLSTTKTREDRL